MDSLHWIALGLVAGVSGSSIIWGWLARADRMALEEVVTRLDSFLAENEPAEDEEQTRTDAFTAHLTAEVQFWRMQFMHERQRAEISVDQRLHERGMGPVTGPLRPDVLPPVDKAIQDLLTNPEFAQAGDL